MRVDGVCVCVCVCVMCKRGYRGGGTGRLRGKVGCNAIYIHADILFIYIIYRVYITMGQESGWQLPVEERRFFTLPNLDLSSRILMVYCSIVSSWCQR